MAVKAGGRRGGQMISVDVQLTGIDKTSAEFKAISRDINGRMRDLMVRVGEREVLPIIRAGFPKLSTPNKRVQAGMMASSLKVVRERSGIFIGSRLRGPKNRALGWIDFGGQRPRDTQYRQGAKVIVHTLDARRALIDSRVLEELEREFHDINNP